MSTQSTVIIEKYCFQPLETSMFILHVLKKCGESTEQVEEDIVNKFIENDDLFHSWILSILEKDFRGGVIKASINYHGKNHSTLFFKEPEIDSNYLIIPIPYMARLMKIIVLQNLDSGEVTVRETISQDSTNILEFSNDNIYVFFNPIKIHNSLSNFIIVTDTGVESISVNNLIKLPLEKKKSVSKKKKKRKSRKRKTKKKKKKQ